MLALLVITILVSGFIACNRHPEYFYRLHRFGSQYLYLKSAQLGTLSVLAFWGFILIFNAVIFDVTGYLETLLGDLFKEEDKTRAAWILLITIGSVFFSILASWHHSVKLLNKGIYIAGQDDKITPFCYAKIAINCLFFNFNDDKCKYIGTASIILMRKIFRDSPYDELLIDACLSQTPIQVCLDTRKVYVGLIIRLGEPNESDGVSQEIAIVPLLDGYMKEGSLEIQYTTAYPPYKEGGKTVDPTIVIMQERIVSISRVDLDDLALKQDAKPRNTRRWRKGLELHAVV